MKLKNNVKIAVLALVAILLIGAFGYYGVKINESRYTDFKDAGYVISTNYNSNNDNEDITSIKYYFSENETYYKENNSSYSFTNSSNESVNIQEDNFIHYNNGSIGVFKKTALVNLNNIGDNIIKYYSLNSKNYLTKEGQNYLAKSISDTYEFTNFILKISANKYMIVAPNIKIHVKNDVRTITDSYVELQYFDGNIVRLENNNFKLQSVASDFYIELDNNVIINIDNKNIYLNKEQKLNLEEITISSDDNVNLDNIDDDKFMTEDEKKKQEEEEKKAALEALEKAKKELADAQDKIKEDIKSNFSKDNPLNGITNGVVKPTSPDNNEEIIEDGNSYDPTFVITNLEVSANGVLANIRYEDKSAVLVGSPTINLIDAGNNKIIDTVHLNNGLTSIVYSNETLNQNTNYVLVVNANYMKNGEAINKDFIQKSFVTSSLGISVLKDYYSTKTLNFIIKKENDSTVTSLNARLYSASGELISNKPINLKDIEKVSLTFDNLEPNTSYRLELSDFVYKNMIISDGFTITESYKTLKRSPRIGGVSFSVDKVNSKFILETNNIEDKDNGITKLRYEVYDMRKLDGTSKPVASKTIETTSLGSVDVNVDDANIYRSVPYTFKVIAIFNDNEKEIELDCGSPSEYMQLDGKVHPSLRFVDDNVTFERISGTIEIEDQYGTVDYSKPFKIIYTDSHGIFKTINYNSATLHIPIDINGLRANNETYTFNVYGYVDLDDGYGSANQLIGTFTVNTNNIKSFTLKSKIDDTTLTKTFRIISQLTPTNGEDNTLEANTLSSLTFNLYSGSNTTGQLIKSVTYTDNNLSEYESDLKKKYYDEEFEIIPELFGLTSNALRSYEALTIEVTNANDYTKWPNTSQIIDNIITIKTKDPIEDPEVNPKIDVSVVRNKDADKNHYDATLNNDTIIGIKALANYDNASHYAKYITYYLYDAENPGNYIAKSDYLPVNADGSIPSTIFYAQSGKASNVEDNTFRRGNSYYVTYIIDVDTNGDGIVEDDIHIPTTGIAASETLDIPKQLPKFQTYPSTILETSNGNNLLWAYKYTDIDNALEINKMYYKVDGIENSSNDISISDGFQTISLSLDKSGLYDLYTKVRLLKTSTPEDYSLVNQTIENLTSIPVGIKYVLTEETNRLMITIADYELYSSFFNKVTGYTLTFTADNTTREFNDVTFGDTGTYIVDLSNLEDFANRNVEVNLYAYYDSNLIGFDTDTTARSTYTNNFAIKQIKNSYFTGQYYIVSGNGLITTPSALNSYFSFSLNKTPNTDGYYNFKLSNDAGFEKNYSLELDTGGFSFIDDNERQYFMPSKIAVTKLTSDNNNFTFNGLVPGVSLMKNGKYLIDAGIDSASINVTVSSASDAIVDNKIYFEVYETDENMIEANSKLLYTKEVGVDELNNPVILDELKPSTYYFFKIKANVNENGKVEYISLYDIDNKTNVINYPIATLSNLVLTSQNISFQATSYTDKKLVFEYSLETTKNIDHIRYELFTVTTDANGNNIYTPLKDSVNVNITDDIKITTNMVKEINIAPATNLKTDKVYAIGLTGYLKKSNGTIYELDTTYSNPYNFNQLNVPYFYIQAERNTSDKTLTFKITPMDVNHTLVNDSYMVGFYDEEGNEIANDYGDIYTSSKIFRLTNVDLSKATTLVITYKANVSNQSDEEALNVRERRFTVNGLNKDGIDVGDVYASTNLNDKSKINLTFSNTTRLSEVTNIRYSIFKDGQVVISTNSLENFTPTLGSCGTSACYVYTLKSIISQTGIYYIQIQFLNKNNNIVDERIVSYAYSI